MVRGYALKRAADVLRLSEAKTPDKWVGFFRAFTERLEPAERNTVPESTPG